MSMSSNLAAGTATALASIVLLLATPTAHAAEPGQRPQTAPTAAASRPTGWQFQLGAGLIVNPEYQGDDDYRLLPIPYVDARYVDDRGTLLFANVPQGIGGYPLRYRSDDGHALDIGVAVAPGFATRDDEPTGLPSLDPATELRAYVEWRRRAWSASLTLAQDLGTGHEGAYAELSMARRGRIGRSGFWSLGPTLRIADGDYNEAQYGVPASAVAASGLPAHDAGSGAEQLGLQGLVSVPVRTHWRWTSIARVGTLLGDRADSPVVASNTQLFFLTALTRRF